MNFVQSNNFLLLDFFNTMTYNYISSVPLPEVRFARGRKLIVILREKNVDNFHRIKNAAKQTFVDLLFFNLKLVHNIFAQ